MNILQNIETDDFSKGVRHIRESSNWGQYQVSAEVFPDDCPKRLEYKESDLDMGAGEFMIGICKAHYPSSTGGNTHTCKHYVGKIHKGNVDYIRCSCLFHPVGAIKAIQERESDE